MKHRNIMLAVGLALMPGLNLPARAQFFTPLHNFTNTPDGANPRQLAWMNDLFYGSTASGGTTGNGSIFEFNTNGAGFSTIYHFTGAIDSGSFPNNLLATNNMIYGTTTLGGTNGVGMIFAVHTNGAGFTPLYSFSGVPDGSYPQAGLTLNGATLYGTAHTGGTNGGGTLFKINTNGTSYTTLHWFTNIPDGFSPQSELVLNGRTLYGTTVSGGAGGFGTVFAITTNGTDYAILHNFTNTLDGAYPYSGLVVDSGVLYGTTILGGSNASGTVFALNTNGTGYRTLYHFTASHYPTNADGIHSKGALTCNAGTLYGTTTSAGAGAGGTLFQINTNGSGFTVIRNFTDNAATGSSPESGVVLLGNTLWGTTYFGGTAGYGLLYSEQLSPVISLQPQSTTVTNGDPACFTVNAADDSRTNYQWYFNETTLLAGQTNNTLNFASTTTNNAGAYSVVVSDDFGSITSIPASLTVMGAFTAPTIAQQPQDLTVTNGDAASFTNAAAGTAPFYYQWYFNTNTPVGGGTNAVLILPFVAASQAGSYSVKVTDTFGAVTSRYARLTISNQPNLLSFALSPADGSVSFSYANLAQSTNRLWATTNLAASSFWRAIATNVMAANGLWFYTDTNAAKSNNLRFYRFSSP